MLILGIETTCDETAAAVVRRHDDGSGEIVSNVVLSQTAHAAYGGVVPEIAARAHVEVLDLVVAKAMVEAELNFDSLDGIAAAAGPGLIGGVIVGLTTAKAIALVAEKPLIAVNHLEAHALTARLTDNTAFPYCLFLASGGHTQIVAVLGVGEYVRIGTTLDDALGEAYDKTAKLLGLPYPGGPEVELEAARGDPKRFFLPRPMVGRPEPDFSLSGLKTALRLEAERIAPLTEQDVADFCASFQDAVIEIVTDRLRVGLRVFRERFGRPTALVVAGGVAANQEIRHAISRALADKGRAVRIPVHMLDTHNRVAQIALLDRHGDPRLRLRAVAHIHRDSYEGARGQLFLEMSTAGPDFETELAPQVASTGSRIMDATIVGAPPIVEHGEAAILVGGDPADAERARPVPEHLGTVRYVGPPGNGARLKLIANSMLAQIVIGAAELQHAGESAGLDPGDVFWLLARFAPTLETRRPAYVEKELQPTMFALHDLRKDLDLALGVFHAEGAPAPMTAIARELVSQALPDFSDNDIGAIVGLYRRSRRDGPDDAS